MIMKAKTLFKLLKFLGLDNTRGYVTPAISGIRPIKTRRRF
jgi:hypothetical protein